MRNLLLLILITITSLNAAEWRSSELPCAMNLPDSPGWQPIPAPEVEGIKVLVAMQNPARQATLGLNIVTKVPNANLRDANTVLILETMLRSFGYEFVGNSTLNIGGMEWKQYPVKYSGSQPPLTGVIRFGSAGGQIYSISMLMGGGKEASQDAELQQAAASFRFISNALNAPPPPGTTSSETPEKTSTTSDAEKKDEIDYVRLAWMAGGLFLVLIILGKIISGPSRPRRY
jgi:hypothetical protein